MESSDARECEEVRRMVSVPTYSITCTGLSQGSGGTQNLTFLDHSIDWAI